MEIAEVARTRGRVAYLRSRFDCHSCRKQEGSENVGRFDRDLHA